MDTSDYRDALSAFPTGVAIVTSITAEGTPIGLTVSSFCSVSLDPRLVSWCIGKDSPRFWDYVNSRHFAIAVLDKEQSDLAGLFSTPVEDKFAQLQWRPGIGGVPVIEGPPVVFECINRNQHDAGDHIILQCEVEKFSAREIDPLVYCRGGFTQVAPAGK
ncbi:MAG: flavin reductase family protein [Pseudomonadota bacterium]